MTLVFFIVFFNVYQGVREVSPVVLSNARMLGMSERQIDTLAAAAVKECTRFHDQGEASRFLLSRDASTIALQQVHPPLREFSVADALARSPAEHWAEAVTMNRDSSAETRDDHGGHGMSVPGYSQHVPGHQAVA